MVILIVYMLQLDILKMTENASEIIKKERKKTSQLWRNHRTGRIATHLESTVELAVLGIHRLGAQFVHASVQRYPQVIGKTLTQILKNRDQGRLQENPGVVKVYRFRRKERHARGYRVRPPALTVPAGKKRA